MTLTSTRGERAAAAMAELERLDAQRAHALNLANAVRSGVAAVKDEAHADPSWDTGLAFVRGSLDRPHVGAVRIGELLTALPGVGERKARTMLRQVGIPSPSRRLEDLTRRQRNNLVEVLAEQRDRLSDRHLARIAAGARHYHRRRAA